MSSRLAVCGHEVIPSSCGSLSFRIEHNPTNCSEDF
jgi:hypothetical protein